MNVNIVLLFITIPALARALFIRDIFINNIAGDSKIRMDDSSRLVDENIINVISANDIGYFKMTDSNLKDGAHVLLGKQPNDVFLRSPTPWHDLYTRYGWSQVTTKVQAVKSTIKDVSSRPVEVYRRLFVNNNTVAEVYSVGEEQKLKETVETTWNINQDVSKDDEVIYSIGVVNRGNSKSFSFMSQWGKNTMVSKTVSVTPGGLQVTVDPGQTIVAVLTATRRNAQIEIDYRTTLNGSVAVNFDPEYRPSSYSTSHHFFNLDINDVMRSAKLPRVFNSTETISITYYSEAKVTVHDEETGTVLLEVPVKVELKKEDNPKETN